MHNFLSTSQWYQCFGVLRVPATAGQHVVKLPRARSLIHTLSGPPVAVPFPDITPARPRGGAWTPYALAAGMHLLGGGLDPLAAESLLLGGGHPPPTATAELMGPDFSSQRDRSPPEILHFLLPAAHYRHDSTPSECCVPSLCAPARRQFHMNVCMSRAAGAEKIWDYIWCSQTQPLEGDRNGKWLRRLQQ